MDNSWLRLALKVHVKLCDLNSWESIPWQDDKAFPTRLEFSQDSKTILPSGDGEVKYWNLQGISQPYEIPNTNGTLTAALDERTVEVFNHRGTSIATLYGHTDDVTDVKISPVDELVATASLDGTIRFWQLANKSKRVFQTNTYPLWHGSNNAPDGSGAIGSDIFPAVNSSFSSDSQTIALPTADANISLLKADGSVDKILKTPKEPVQDETSKAFSNPQVVNISFSPDDETIAALMTNGQIGVWDRQGNTIRTFDWQAVDAWQSVDRNGFYKPRMLNINFDAQGQLFVLAMGSTGAVHLWNLTTNEIRDFENREVIELGVRFSPNKEVLALLRENNIELWDIKGKMLYTLEGHTGWVLDASFSPDGRTLATVSFDSTVKLWSLQNGQELRSFSGHNAAVTAVSFSPDGKTIISGSDDRTIRFWDLDGNEIISLDSPNGNINGIGFSPDGQMMTIAGSSGAMENANVLFVNQNLDELLIQGCSWLQDYFRLYQEERGLCDGTIENSQPEIDSAYQTPPAQAVLDYYSAVDDEQYEEAWQMLSTEFRREHVENSYADFKAWWEKVSNIYIKQVSSVEVGTETATVDIRFQYSMHEEEDPNTLSILNWRIYLARNEDGQWIFKDRERLDNLSSIVN